MINSSESATTAPIPFGGHFARLVLAATLTIVVLGAITVRPVGHAETADKLGDTENAAVKTSSAGLATKVAPGELLPISVELSNFGAGRRVDVLIQYEIFASSDEKVFSANETVAIETTSNFVKTLQIPHGIAGGLYRVRTSITYQGQRVPATTEFSFQVEPKILGSFRSDFLLYGGAAVLIGAFTVLVVNKLIKHRKSSRLAHLDYSNIPGDRRVFYELISDTVMGMRQKVGDKALDIATETKGLKIDRRTGRVLELSNTPSAVIAELVLGYERILGKKVSFSFRQSNKSKESIKS